MFKTILAILILTSGCVSSAIEIQAKSWLIADGEGNLLEQENIHAVQSIASITKLMTVMVVLDSNDNLNEIIKLKEDLRLKNEMISVINDKLVAIDLKIETTRVLTIEKNDNIHSGFFDASNNHLGN